MARFKYQMTLAKSERYMREHRGEGEGASYRPWITVQDVPSRGRSHRVSCQKTGGRTMEFLSDHEYAAFLELWWDEDVTDIREQYPLDLNQTLRIAAQLGIKHPSDPRTGVLLRQTTDLLATKSKLGYETLSAWAVKDKSDIQKIRITDKLEIERRYWHEKEVPWELVINEGMNSFRTLNLDWLLEFENALRMGKVQINGDCIRHVLDAIREKQPVIAGTVCSYLDRNFSSAQGAHLTALRFLFLSRLIQGNFEEKKLSRQLISTFKVAS